MHTINIQVTELSFDFYSFRTTKWKKLEVIGCQQVRQYTLCGVEMCTKRGKGRNEEFKDFDVELRLLRCYVLRVPKKIPHALYIQELHKYSRF